MLQPTNMRHTNYYSGQFIWHEFDVSAEIDIDAQ